MVLFNYATKEITAKVVYYGPGLCGKTTNLHFIYDSLPSSNKSKMLSLATQTDRTLFFDFLPIDLGKIRGMRTRLQLYTVPGQVYYNSTRQLVLKGADGVVFVADSQDAALDANLESLQNLSDNLKRQGIRITEIPLVLQYNKRDLPNAMPVAELEASLNKLGVRSFESVATTGVGVEATLNGIAQIVLSHLAKKYGLEGPEDLEKEIQVLNPAEVTPREEQESVWEEEPAAVAAQGGIAPAEVLPAPEESERLSVAPSEFVAPSLIDSGQVDFDELISGFEQPDDAADDAPTVVPIGTLDFIPEPDRQSSPEREGSSATARVAEGELVKEITLPLNLTRDELEGRKRLKVRVTLDVNILD
jgi:hypothetical protein